MAGRGPAPKANSRTRHKPIRGEWQATPGIGWQHGPVPGHPGALRPAVVDVWQTWMRSWFASHWLPEDMPGLSLTIQLYEQVQAYFDDPYVEKETRKGDTIYVLRPNPATELRQMMDNYGITPKGQQDRRWAIPKADAQLTTAVVDGTKSAYSSLRVVNE